MEPKRRKGAPADASDAGRGAGAGDEPQLDDIVAFNRKIITEIAKARTRGSTPAALRGKGRLAA